MVSEKYYFCLNCMDLKTETAILEDCSGGGTGLCDCKFIEYRWSVEYDSYEPVYWREYTGYTEITKKLYDILKKVPQIDRVLHYDVPVSEMVIK